MSKLKEITLKINYLDKRKKIIVSAALIIINFFIFTEVVYLFNKLKIKESPLILKTETLAERQLKEIDALRAKTDVQTTTQETIQKQLKEIDILSSETIPLSSQQIKKQVEELDKLRQQ